MFKNLTNFSYQRNIKEAVGFYLAYLILLTISAGILAGIIGVITQIDDFNFGLRIGAITSIIFSFVISFLILKEKKLFNNFGFILLALSSALLALFLGGLGGLIPAAYLSTKPANIN